MGRISGYVVGQNLVHRYKLGATFTAAQGPGIPMLAVAATTGVGPCTTTGCADGIGLSLSSGLAYNTTTNSAGTAEGTVEVDMNPFAIIEMTANGGATNGTGLVLATNTSAETAGTVITSATPSADMDGGMVWRYQNGCGGESRAITSVSAGVSMTVTVPFSVDIAANDTFLYCPWNDMGTGADGADGNSFVQLTTTLDQADATIASGTGIKAVVVELLLNGRYDSAVRFVLRDHIFCVGSLAN